MNNKSVSSWTRQARHRAKKYESYNDLDVSDVLSILQDYKDKCAYCKAEAETIDHPFPIKDGSPNVPANILPVCKSCKNKKKNNDIIWLFTEKHISNNLYVAVIERMLSKRGSELVRECVKKATGIQ